jgi:antitoxin component of RelBE/YafQ-DinJ toxin-antitoxin module
MNDSTQKNFRISRKLLSDFQIICDNKGIDSSELLRVLILEYVDKNKEAAQK